jgi:subtilisin family serine protease
MQMRIQAPNWLVSVSLTLLLLLPACATAPSSSPTPTPATNHATITLSPRFASTPGSPAARGQVSTPTPWTLSEMQVRERVLPSPYLAPMVIRAPIAWKRSTGKGVRVAVIRNHEEDLALLNLVAPDVIVEPVQVAKDMTINGELLSDRLYGSRVQILVILEPRDFDARALNGVVSVLAREGVAIFVNGDFRLATDDAVSFTTLELNGAIVIGRLDMNGKARGSETDLFAPYGLRFEKGAALTAAGVGALVLAVVPNLTPAALKQQLNNTADSMYQASDLSTGQWNPGAIRVDPRTGDYSPAPSAFRFRRINAARAVGVTLDQRWPVNALNAPAAWKTATGRGVTVAVIDQGFHVDNPAFEGHLVDKAAFFPGQDFGSIQNFHGTAMAKIVLSIAPDASLVFLHTGESNQFETMAKAYAQAIDYAIGHQVKVITSSAGPWPNTAEVHAAIDRAIAAGVTFVWFHYNGRNRAVIRPGYFYDATWEVGAFDRFFEDDKPSDLEAGLSMTAPQIAAIAALILQNEPKLSPIEVKQRILETAVALPNGSSLADAAAAVENRPSGRQWPSSVLPASDGRVMVSYRGPGSADNISVEIQEQGRHWPIAAWPPRDILFYPVTDAARTAGFRFQMYRDGNLFLAASVVGGQLASGEATARVVLYPRGPYEPYTALLDGKTAPLLQVQVDGDRVRLAWELLEGVGLDRMDASGTPSPSEYRLYRLQIETRQLPALTMSNY